MRDQEGDEGVSTARRPWPEARVLWHETRRTSKLRSKGVKSNLNGTPEVLGNSGVKEAMSKWREQERLKTLERRVMMQNPWKQMKKKLAVISVLLSLWSSREGVRKESRQQE